MRLAAGNLFCFSKSCAIAPVCGFLFAHRPWEHYDFSGSPMITGPALASAPGSSFLQGSGHRAVASWGLVWGVLCTFRPYGEMLSWDTPRGLWGWLPAKVLKQSVESMPFNLVNPYLLLSFSLTPIVGFSRQSPYNQDSWELIHCFQTLLWEEFAHTKQLSPLQCCSGQGSGEKPC